MSGNVSEWCYDYVNDGDYDYSGGAETDPTGAESGIFRVDRGGWRSSQGEGLRCAYRFYSVPSERASAIGFRLCRTAD